MFRGGASSSSNKSGGNIAPRDSSDPSNDRFSGKGRKHGNTVDDDGQELILQESIGHGRTAPERTWMRLDNSAGFLRRYITGIGPAYMDRAGEKDMESGTGAGEEHSSKSSREVMWDQRGGEDREDLRGYLQTIHM